MINVSITKENDLTKLVVKGHSGYAEKGKDIVCAGVSSIVQAYAFVSVENGGCESYQIEDGFLEVVVKDSDRNDIRLEMVKTALEGIAEEYPSNLTIEE